MERVREALRSALAGGRLTRAGQAYTEYGLVLVIIGIAVVGSLTLMGHSVHNMYQNVSVAVQH